MFKYIRKNRRKVLAIASVGLMIAFAAPTTCTQFKSRGEGEYGSLYGGAQKLTGREFQSLQGEWSFLKQRFSPVAIAVAIGTSGIGSGDELLTELLGNPAMADEIQRFYIMSQQNPFMMMQNPNLQFMMRAFQEGQFAYAQIENNDEMFPLLVKEAQANGTTVSNDQLEMILARMGSTHDTDPYHQNLRQSLNDLLLVMNNYKRAAGVMKVSQPARQYRLASSMQEMSANLVEFNAKDFLSQVGEPTPQQIQAQFDKYKDTLAESSSSGFGYKYPNRVKFDSISINKEQIRKAVGEIDLVDMFEYFERNKNKPEMILTTQPATRPNDQLNLSNLPASQPRPTTRPKTFEEAKEQIRTTLADQRIGELSNKVRDAVRNTLVSDYNAWKVAQAAGKGGATQPSPKSSLGPAYNTYEYLQALRDKIQKDFNVTLTIERRDQWQSATSMKETDLARLTWDPQTAQPIDFPRMMTMRLDAFVPEDARKQLAGSRLLALWEPTPLFTNELQTEALIARATVAEPSHSPKSLDEVKDKVAADTKLAVAYDKAKQAAQAMVDAAKSGKWLQSVADEQKKKMFTTGAFTPGGGGFFGSMPVPGYTQLKGPALAAFKTEAFKLLALPPRAGGTAPRISNPITPATTQSTTQPATQTARATTQPATRPAIAQATTQPATAPTPSAFKDHPIGLVEIPTESKVLVLEVDSLKAAPGWTKESESLVQLQSMIQQRMAEESQLRVQWFNPDNTRQRVNFKPTIEKDRPKQPQQPIPNPNPFVGVVLP
jgi:hypothetical protein